MLLRTARFILIRVLLLHSVAACGFSQDPRLLQLVPTESQIVAGTRNSSASGKLSGMLLVTRNNETDRTDFFALTGGDASRAIHEFVFVASSGRGGVLSDHSLLVSGHFDREAVFRFSDKGSASRESYRGVPVLAVPAFARERGLFNELRWLAIPDEKIAIFGSIRSVQEELDRWIANSPPEPWILKRLSLLGGGEDAWCLMPAPRKGGLVEDILTRLDRRLGTAATEGGPLEYGLHFGRNVEVTASSGPTAEASSGVTAAPPELYSDGGSYLLPRSNKSAGDETNHIVVVKIAQRRYQAWVAECSGGKCGAFLP